VAVVSGGGGGGGTDIGAEIRRQVSDTPVSMPEPQGLGQAQVASEELTPRQAAELSVDAPGVARSPADVMTVPVPAAPREVASAITPVPGGVGPMTIACLLRNTLVAAHRRAGLPDPEGF
jgi:hypothetical protein